MFKWIDPLLRIVGNGPYVASPHVLGERTYWRCGAFSPFHAPVRVLRGGMECHSSR